MTRTKVIQHIMTMHKSDPSYAEKAHKWYCGTLPWLELPSWAELIGVRAAIGAQA